MKRPTLDEVKDLIDECVRVDPKRTSRKCRAAIERAKDLIDYIESVHIFQLQLDEREYATDERRERAKRKVGAK